MGLNVIRYAILELVSLLRSYDGQLMVSIPRATLKRLNTTQATPKKMPFEWWIADGGGALPSEILSINIFSALKSVIGQLINSLTCIDSGDFHVYPLNVLVSLVAQQTLHIRWLLTFINKNCCSDEMDRSEKSELVINNFHTGAVLMDIEASDLIREIFISQSQHLGR